MQISPSLQFQLQGESSLVYTVYSSGNVDQVSYIVSYVRVGRQFDLLPIILLIKKISLMQFHITMLVATHMIDIR